MTRSASWLLGIAGGTVVAAAGLAAYVACADDGTGFFGRLRVEASAAVTAVATQTTRVVRQLIGAVHREVGADFQGVAYRIETQRSSRWALPRVTAWAKALEPQRYL